MRNTWILLLLFAECLWPVTLAAQEKTDTLASGLTAEDIEELKMTTVKPTTMTPMEIAPLQPISAQANDLPLRPELEPQQMPMHWYSFPILKRGDYLPHWYTGFFYGMHDMYGDPLNGFTSYTTMGVSQNMGEYWSLNAGLSFQKSFYYNMASFDTSVNWHPSKYFSLTAFASYMPGSFFSQMQSVPAFHWGGFATFQTDTDLPFGIDLGASDYYNSLSGHQVVPIVKPFIKLGGSKLGIDFGPMIYDAINKSNHKSIGGGMNPIPQPIKAIPPVAPRR